MPAGKLIRISSRKPRRKPVTRSTVSRMISYRQEKKYKLSTFNNTSDTTAVITDLNSISQGDGDSNRDGDTLYLTKFHIKGAVENADTTNVLRVLVFRWYEDATPTAANVIEAYAGDGLDVFRPMRKDTSQQYHVLFDRNIATSTQGPGVTTFQKTVYGKALGRKVVKYKGATTSGNGKIYSLTVSDSSAATHPTLKFAALTNYTDS